MWRGEFAAYINLPVSEQDKIKSQHASDRDRKLALPHVFISAHPTPSWELVAHGLYQMGVFDDSCHRALEYLQQHFPTGTVCMYMHYSTRLHEHTWELPRSRARVNYCVPGYANLSRLNPDSIHLGGESRLDPNYCASVNTALVCTLYYVNERCRMFISGYG